MTSSTQASKIYTQLDNLLYRIESESFVLGDLNEILVPVQNTFTNLRKDLMALHQGDALPPLSLVMETFETALAWLNKLRLGSSLASVALRNTSTEDSIYCLLVEFAGLCQIPETMFGAIWSREQGLSGETLRKEPKAKAPEGHVRKGEEIRDLRSWLEKKANGHWGKDLGSAVMNVIMDRFEEEYLGD